MTRGKQKRSRAQMGVSGGLKTRKQQKAAKKGGQKKKDGETMSEGVIDDWNDDTKDGVLSGQVPKGTANVVSHKKNHSMSQTQRKNLLNKKQKHVAKYRLLKEDEAILKEMGEEGAAEDDAELDDDL
jgi:hypothetical protein